MISSKYNGLLCAMSFNSKNCLSSSGKCWFRVHDFCGGRFPSDYVLPKLECKSLILNGGMDRFCGDPKKDFVPVLKHSK